MKRGILVAFAPLIVVMSGCGYNQIQQLDENAAQAKQQISVQLRREHPDDPRWWVSTEAIYASLFVQGRGGLRDELSGAAA